MTTLLLIRHGETEWNVGEVFRGRIDVGLNDTGREQAQLLAEYLHDFSLEAVFSSPLQRAQQTAAPCAQQYGLNVQVAADLVDFDYGEWQGLPRREVEERYGELYRLWRESPHLVRMPGGESLAEVRRRAMGVVDALLGQYRGTVALVSHRVVNKVLICALLGLDDAYFWNIKQDTCGLTIFTRENGRFVLMRHNDTSYLRVLGKEPLGDF